jgi:hypothetical protein
MNPELQKLYDTIQRLEREVEVLKNTGITRDLPVEQQDAIREIVKDKIQEMTWDEYSYIQEFFSTTTGFTLSSSSGSVSFIKGVDLITSGHKQFGKQMPNNGEFVTFDKETFFRVNAVWGEKTGQTCYIRTLNDGAYGSISSLGRALAFRSAIGFKVKDNNLFGISQANGKETSILLVADFEIDTSYQLELRYFPRDRVDFFIGGDFYGSISSNLPISSENNISIFEAYVQSDDGGSKDMYVEYYEFQQKRK